MNWATRDGTATAGEDYVADSGTLVFSAGELEKTVSVAVLNDTHDDDGETVILALSNPDGAVLAPYSSGEATGTIENTDGMPQAWLARFGRTVAEQMIDAVEQRIRAPRTPGASLHLAGARLSTSALQKEGAAIYDPAHALADRVRGAGDETAFDATSTSFAELLSGASFSLVGGDDGQGRVAVWGRAAENRFDGRERDTSLDGEVSSALLGVDWLSGPVMAGLILSHSDGEGGYRGASDPGSTSSDLTGLYPWGHYQLSRRLSVWGMAGYGEGTLRLTPEGEETMRTDLELLMAAAGLRGELVQAPEGGGVELAFKGDAMGVRTRSERTLGLASAEADVTRVRLGLEGARSIALESGAMLRPRLEIGLRHDDGDAETGFGTDVGAGIAWASAQRSVNAELHARALLTHEASGFEQEGVSVSLVWDPKPTSGLGPSLTLIQTLGAPSTGGMDALMERTTLAGLARTDDDHPSRQRQLELHLGYGYTAGPRFTATPELGVALSPDHREYRAGWKLDLASRRRDSLKLRFDVRRGESDGEDTAPEHTIGLRLNAGY